MERRDFLKLAGVTAAYGFSSSAMASATGRVSVVVDETSESVQWAAEQLRKALSSKGVACEVVQSAEQAAGSTFCVATARPGSRVAREFPGADAEIAGAESLRMMPGRIAETQAVLVAARGERGFIYGLLELAERVRFSADPMATLRRTETVEEKPANEVRCVGRYFCSEVEDKSWYYDKEFWEEYLDVLVASRFNRFNLGFGLGYDFPRGVTGDYFHFPYPYLVEVPGYPSVRAVQLATAEGKRLATPVALGSAERERNLEMLRFIAAETGKRGLEFQLGLWTHAYQWTDSPNAYHRIEGLTPETHATYCRDALAILLRECPQIQGLTLRVHGESGVPEGSYPFWKTLFESISGCGRKVEIDMHAKGVNQIMIDMAADTGMPVKLGAKYSAEHQSLGYQQADIRALEIPKPNHEASGPFSVSGGARLFTRYGYADFLRQGRRYDLLFRLWPGTQRHLLSCDPEMAAAYGRSSHFCGAVGLDICEPLTFKGREGSGLPGGRCAYADESLKPEKDWRKFEAFYRVWGRKLYDPEAEPESWRRLQRSQFGPGAPAVETAMANASRVLPLVTSAHLPSASNHAFWPELYANMPIVEGSEHSPYDDTPKPKCFGTVSPLDPQLFSTIIEHADDLLAGRANAKYSPIEVAQWLEDMTTAAGQALATARGRATKRSSPEFRRMEEDVLIENGLGQFFACKLRSGVLFAIHQQTGDAEAGKQALAHYQQARDAWDRMAQRARSVYRLDITYGDIPQRRGHWSDRIAGIDVDIEAMRMKLQSAQIANGAASEAARAVRAVTGRPVRSSVPCLHTPPERFTPGKALALSLKVPESPMREAPDAARLWYRHVDQAERWLSVEMQRSDGGYAAAIPGGYTQSAFPLAYYFELRHGSKAAWLYPGFNATLSSQPYFAVYRRNTAD